MLQFTKQTQSICGCLICLMILQRAMASDFHSRWAQQLLSEDSAKADQAVLKLFQGGSQVLPDLVKLTSNTTPFNGLFGFDDYESQIRPERPTVGVISLYLIQAICEKDLFFARPWLVPRANAAKPPLAGTSATMQEAASRAYLSWWTATKGTSVAQRCDALESSGIRWTGRR